MPPSPQSLRDEFLLDSQVTYLNHGSFGACPRPVFERYQALQRELEREPIDFLGRGAVERMASSRQVLGSYLNVPADDLVYFPNPTTAVNMVARSLTSGPAALRPGDEILTTDHEYGALDRTWQFVCEKTGARYVQRHMPLPVESPSEFADAFWAGVVERTRVVYISHITSSTALIFPVQEICRRARAAGLLSIVDGAHAVSQLALDLQAVGADVYTGACHKWLCAPKGAAFLYVRQELQPALEPLVVSWGWRSARPGPSQFIDRHEWQGTRDISAFLSVPAAIEFQAKREWAGVRARCHELACLARDRLNALTGLDPVCPGSQEWFGQMFVARLPEVDLVRLGDSLRHDHRVEVPLIRWNGEPLIRVSLQGYNTVEDVDRLVAALADVLPRLR